MSKMFIFLITMVLTYPAIARAEKSCGSVREPVPYEYCITKSESSNSKSVLYYLHGGGGDKNSWGKVGNILYPYWTSKKLDAPVVINISFGPFWLLVEKNKSEKSGLLELFKKEVMPYLESLALGGPAENRLLLGASMGGVNAVQIAAKLPIGTFEKIAMICPAFVELSPWASLEEKQAFVKSNNAELEILDNISAIAKNFVATEETWKESVSPFVLVEKIRDKNISFFIATNDGDKTFKSGGYRIATELSVQFSSVVYERWPGPHCNLSEESVGSLANFLSTID